MHRQFLHRCLVVLLLVSKLAFGAFAHAAPHAASVDVGSAMASDTQPCPDHMQDEGAATPEPTQESQHHGGASHDGPMSHDCCEQGACDCPCPYTPGAVSVALQGVTMTPTFRITAQLDGAVSPRPTALFRPPA